MEGASWELNDLTLWWDFRFLVRIQWGHCISHDVEYLEFVQIFCNDI